MGDSLCVSKLSMDSVLTYKETEEETLSVSETTFMQITSHNEVVNMIFRGSNQDT